jgi:hypothetical protein
MRFPRTWAGVFAAGHRSADALVFCAAIVAVLHTLPGCMLLPGPEQFLLYPPGFSTAESPMRGEWILVSSTTGDSTQKSVYVRRGHTLADARETITCESYPKPPLTDPGTQMNRLVSGLYGPCVRIASLSQRGDSDLSFHLLLGCPGEPQEQIIGRVIYGNREAFQIIYRAPGTIPAGNIAELISDFKLSTK